MKKYSSRLPQIQQRSMLLYTLLQLPYHVDRHQAVFGIWIGKKPIENEIFQKEILVYLQKQKCGVWKGWKKAKKSLLSSTESCHILSASKVSTIYKYGFTGISPNSFHSPSLNPKMHFSLHFTRSILSLSPFLLQKHEHLCAPMTKPLLILWQHCYCGPILFIQNNRQIHTPSL